MNSKAGPVTVVYIRLRSECALLDPLVLGQELGPAFDIGVVLVSLENDDRPQPEQSDKPESYTTADGVCGRAGCLVDLVWRSTLAKIKATTNENAASATFSFSASVPK